MQTFDVVGGETEHGACQRLIFDHRLRRCTIGRSWGFWVVVWGRNKWWTEIHSGSSESEELSGEDLFEEWSAELLSWLHTVIVAINGVHWSKGVWHGGPEGQLLNSKWEQRTTKRKDVGTEWNPRYKEGGYGKWEGFSLIPWHVLPSKKTEFLDKSSKTIDTWPVFFEPKWSPTYLHLNNTPPTPAFAASIGAMESCMGVVRDLIRV